VSVAGEIEKGKFLTARQSEDLARVKYSRRPLWQRLGAFMALEIPQKQDEKYNHRKHADAEVVSRSIGTAS
jgi:hypothetical protein